MKRGKAAASSGSKGGSMPVRVNVGGQVFWTTSTTLTSTTGHYLYHMFKDVGEEGMQGTQLLDADGVPFIDREPRWFPLILNFLRDGYVPLPPTLHERQQLRQEALFYGLQTLATAIEQADKATVKPKDWGRVLPSADVTQQSQLEDATTSLANMDAQLVELTRAVNTVAQQLQDMPVAETERLEAELARIARRLSLVATAVGGDDAGDSDGEF